MDASNPTPDIPPTLSLAELREWALRLAAANQYNLLHHCRTCGNEWVASQPVPCACGSRNIERIACWQFPDD